MAKTKDAPKAEPETAVEHPDGSLVKMAERTAFDRERADLNDRIKALEDVLARVQPELHRFRMQLPNTSVAFDCNELYKAVRAALGKRGDDIDRAMRGG